MVGAGIDLDSGRVSMQRRRRVTDDFSSLALHREVIDLDPCDVAAIGSIEPFQFSMRMAPGRRDRGRHRLELGRKVGRFSCPAPQLHRQGLERPGQTNFLRLRSHAYKGERPEHRSQTSRVPNPPGGQCRTVVCRGDSPPHRAPPGFVFFQKPQADENHDEANAGNEQSMEDVKRSVQRRADVIVSQRSDQRYAQAIGQTRHDQRRADQHNSSPCLAQPQEGHWQRERQHGNQIVDPAAFPRDFEHEVRQHDDGRFAKDRNANRLHQGHAQLCGLQLERPVQRFGEGVPHRNHEEQVRDRRRGHRQGASAEQEQHNACDHRHERQLLEHLDRVHPPERKYRQRRENGDATPKMCRDSNPFGELFLPRPQQVGADQWDDVAVRVHGTSVPAVDHRQ